jgi:hypothetical protein
LPTLLFSLLMDILLVYTLMLLLQLQRVIQREMRWRKAVISILLLEDRDLHTGLAIRHMLGIDLLHCFKHVLLSFVLHS